MLWKEKTTGQKIKQERELHGMTVEQLAEAAGISAEDLRKYEADEVFQPVDELIRIIKAINVTIFKVISNDRIAGWGCSWDDSEGVTQIISEEDWDDAAGAGQGDAKQLQV